MNATLFLAAALLVTQQSQPTTAPATGEPEAIFDRLLGPGTRADPPPLRPTPRDGTAPTNVPSVAPNVAPAPLLREGTFLVDRAGRLTRDGPWWALHLVADDGTTAPADPPLRVLPSGELTLMREQLDAQQRDLVFRVTGELTAYEGRNYVLVSRVVVLPPARP